MAGCVVNAAPLGVGELGEATTASCDGAAAFTVAVKTMGLPEAPFSVAVTVAVPTPLGSVQPVTAAMPLEFVVTTAGLAGAIVPPATVKVTATFGTGFCAASRTITAGRAFVGTALPASPLSVVDTFAAIELAVPALSVTCDVVEVTPADENVIVTGPAGPLTPRFVNVAVPLGKVVALVVPISV
jgi:hypothetical protein